MLTTCLSFPSFRFRYLFAKHYYDFQTELAIRNFPFSVHTVHKELIYTIVEIKKAAITNGEIGQISKIVSRLICQACDEVLLGKY